MIKKLLPLNHKYSVHSGVFSGIDGDISMQLDEYGEYQYVCNHKINDTILKKLNELDIMSDYSSNEDLLGYEIFGKLKNIKHNNLLGYYNSLYAGYIKEGTFRERASSGGFGTWILCELLRLGFVDYVIHPTPVDPKNNDGILFRYKISKTIDEIQDGSKSFYYPVELSEVLKNVKKTPGKYAIIGISDYITELRLLCEKEDIFKKRIKFMVGLFNAHQKTTKYAEALAWEQGIKPGNLKKVNFRVKSDEGEAWEYCHHFESLENDIDITKNIKNSPLQRWNLGFFKSYFSDFTDNAFNELADITIGDAWLNDYIKDPKGNNILIIRNNIIKNIINNAILENRVQLDVLDEETMISSQQIVSHIINELPYRLYKEGKHNYFVPKKRIKPLKKISLFRRLIQTLRIYILNHNKYIYKKAVQKNNFSIYINFANKCLKLNDFLYKIHNKKNIIYILFKNIIRKIINILSIFLYKIFIVIKKIINKLVRKFNIRMATIKFISFLKNRKKDGAILSLTGYYNYGNILQRYALKKILEKNGYFFDSIKVQTFIDRQDRKVYGYMIDFVDKYIKEKTISSNLEMIGYKNYIVGSDQVWRNWYGDDWSMFGVFFLDFLGKRKALRIAYAASFGVDNLDEANIYDKFKPQIKELIRKFDYISVREDTGVNLVCALADDKLFKVNVVLDPVFLLDKDEYSNLVDNSEIKNIITPKMFCYILDMCDKKKSYIQNMAKNYNDDYQIINPHKNKKYSRIEEWLKGFRDSEFVITDSFHGVVLSIINNKDFVVFVDNIRGNSRIKNLLDYFGIDNDRMINFNSNIDMMAKINWSSVNDKIEEGVKESKYWLLNKLKNNNIWSKHEK